MSAKENLYTSWGEGRELGAGTFGEVRAARRKSDGLEVALKRIKRDASEVDAGVSYSALREIRVIRELRHPNIMGLHDVFVSGNQVIFFGLLNLLSPTMVLALFITRDRCSLLHCETSAPPLATDCPLLA